ncbi:flagellar hook-basal body protein [bacterium]|nr:flagellar hook-basal body protein [bacterium]
MIRGIYTSAAGMSAEMARQEVLANNLANVNTSGFKQDMAVFRTRLDKTIYRVDAQGGARAGVPAVQKMGDLSSGVYLDEVATRYGQGNLLQTDEPLDLALSGEGFFVIQAENGEELLSRGGSFKRDAEGFLADDSGRRVLGEAGPIRLAAQGKVFVDQSGNVKQGTAGIGKLRLVRLERPEASVEKRGETAWRLKDPGAIIPGARPEVLQGYLEASNVNPVREMVEMISVQRAYEASQKMISAQDETLGKAVNEIGRG